MKKIINSALLITLGSTCYVSHTKAMPMVDSAAPAPTPTADPAPIMTPPPIPMPTIPTPEPMPTMEMPAPTPAPMPAPTLPPPPEATPSIPPTPAAPMATPTTPTTQPTPAATPTAAPNDTLQAPTQEIEQLNNIVEEIKTIKQNLQQELAKTQDEIQNARTNYAQMRDKSKAILQSSQESESQELLKSVTDLQGTISTINTNVTSTMKKSIEDAQAKLQSLIQQGTELTQKIQDKGHQFHVSQLKIKEREEQIKREEALAKKRALEEQGIWNRITSWIAKAVKRMQKFILGFKTIIKQPNETQPQQHTTPESVEKKKSSNATDTPSSTNSTTTSPTPRTEPTAPTTGSEHATPPELETVLQQTDTALLELEKIQKQTAKQLVKLDEQTTLFSTVEDAPALSENIASIESAPRWKRMILFVTSELIDAGEYAVQGVITLGKKIYDYLFSGIVQRVVVDVHEKLQEKDALKEQQEKEQGSPEQQPSQEPATADVEKQV